MQINVRPLVYKKLGQLLEALLEEDYFLDEENALAYVKQIRSTIANLPKLRHYSTKNSRYGRYYASYKANRRTTWYILFDMEIDRYVVRNIINNHTPDYPKFIASLK